VSCPSCQELLVLRPGLTEIWCGRCGIGYEIYETKLNWESGSRCIRARSQVVTSHWNSRVSTKLFASERFRIFVPPSKKSTGMP